MGREIQFHLERETEENLRRGMSPDDARRRALVSFGGVAQTASFKDARPAPERFSVIPLSATTITTATVLYRLDRLGRQGDVIAVRQLIAEAYPHSFNAWMNLGEALLRAGRHEESEQVYDRASEIGLAPDASNRGEACFNLGCGYARLGKKEKALAALEQAVAAGFANRQSYETHAALASLRTEPRFQQLLAQLPKS